MVATVVSGKKPLWFGGIMRRRVLVDNAIAAAPAVAHKCVEPLALLLSGTLPRRDTTRSSFTSDGAADRSKGRGNIGALHFGRRWKNKRQEVDGDLVELYANHLHGAYQRTLFVRWIGWN